MTLKNLTSQKISFPFTCGNWRVRIFSEHTLFIFPRFKGGGDLGNGVRVVLYSSRGKNKHYKKAEFSLNKEKLTAQIGCLLSSEHPVTRGIQQKLFAETQMLDCKFCEGPYLSFYSCRASNQQVSDKE